LDKFDWFFRGTKKWDLQNRLFDFIYSRIRNEVKLVDLDLVLHEVLHVVGFEVAG